MASEILKDGKWEKGRAGPEHLREELRKLPSTFITKDPDEGDLIHELDDPHIVHAIKDDLKKEEEAPSKESEEKALDRFSFAKLGEKLPFTKLGAEQRQKEVDVVRMRIIRMILHGLTKQAESGKGVDLSIFDRKLYAWFPEDDVNHYEWPEGNAPANCDRPEYLKNLELHIDLLNWPPRIVDYLTRRGIPVPAPSDVYNSLVQVEVIDPLEPLNEPDLDEYAEAIRDVQAEDGDLH